MDTKKTIVINGNNFSDLEGFFFEMDLLLTSGMEAGHNLNAFNDLLRGGFGIYEYGEPVTIAWENSAKSRTSLRNFKDGTSVYEALAEIIRKHEHIEFIEK